MRFENWSEDKIDRDKPYWVGFNVFPGVGPGIFRKLISYFETAEAAWKAEESELEPILGGKVWERFREFRRGFEPEGYIREIYRIGDIRKIGDIRVLMIPEDGYPELLRKIPDPPPVLYVLGDSVVLSRPMLAVVGSRKMTDYGRQATQELVDGLVEAGLVVTSGLAFGVDTAAHKAAIKAGGETVAVLGCGVDICYPAEHREVYEEIIGVRQEESRAESFFEDVRQEENNQRGESKKASLGENLGSSDVVNDCNSTKFSTPLKKTSTRLSSKSSIAKGAVVSEIPVGVRTNRGIFVTRNRIIAGMSLGVLVVEGARKSGTLITAGYAGEYGRTLFAVPGPITSEFSEGPNDLIAKGAKTVRSAEDVLEELKAQSSKLKIIRQDSGRKGNRQKFGKIRKIDDLDENERMIIKVLQGEGGEGVQVDTIVRKVGIGGGDVGGVLGRLEVKGIVRRGEGGRYFVA